MVKLLSFFVIFMIVVVGFSVWYSPGKTDSVDRRVGIMPTLTIAPTPTPVLPKIVEVVSPDMKATLTMKEQKNKRTTTHTFSTLGDKGKLPIEIFTTSVFLPETVTVPFNAWSPGNKYLFLKKTGGGFDSYIVLKSGGQPFSNDLQFLKVEELFSKKYIDYKITDVTGWAGPTLLVVNTDKLDGAVGPSFWLDVSSLSFIRLSTRFN